MFLLLALIVHARETRVEVTRAATENGVVGWERACLAHIAREGRIGSREQSQRVLGRAELLGSTPGRLGGEEHRFGLELGFGGAVGSSSSSSSQVVLCLSY